MAVYLYHFQFLKINPLSFGTQYLNNDIVKYYVILNLNQEARPIL